MSVKMIFGYIRVSTKEQNVERQTNALVGCDKIFIDRVSGKSADRPELNTMKQQLREGDTVRVKSVDRLARNTQDLLTLLSEITGQGVKVEFIDNQMGFDNNPTSKFMITLLAAVAELERSFIRQRQKEGITIAKQKGRYKGRPVSDNALKAQKLITEKLSGKLSLTDAEIMQLSGIQHAQFYRLKKVLKV
ncbi:DNA invertase Pin-like site-specific DNA recombinase [Providencia alcalifaciens]|nr:DNA invertase Pin-like site-specific DNA recombinase [Providencia alcalifaciens]